jgi:DNA invertase Pin-like site-specific DNA recombinase
MIVGYARTSTVDQVAGFEAQFKELSAAGCDKGRKPIAPERQKDVLRLAAEGATKTSIARQLGIGEATVYRILAVAKE